jgi:nucleotide-binding universal stress UspA family protein
MAEQPAVTDRIVVAVDGSEGSRIAFRWAIAEAELRGSSIEAVHVWQYLPSVGLPGMPVVPTAQMMEWARTLVDGEVSKAPLDTGTSVAIEGTIAEGSPVQHLTEIAADSDLLVVGARGLGGFAALVLGSVSQRSAQQATVPVAIVREEATAEARQRVAVGVDGSSGAGLALTWAAEEARRRGAALEVVLAWSFLDQPLTAEDAPKTFANGFDQAAAEAVLADILDRAGDVVADLDVVRTAVCELPAVALLEASERSDLVVVGARGLGGFKRLTLGSVSHQVAQHAIGPVVVVPSRKAR